MRSLDDHLTTCEYALLYCPNECIENKKEIRVLRCNLHHHLKNKCPNRQYQCPHCKTTGRYRFITTIHLDICKELKFTCPNTECEVLVTHSDQSDHRSKCQFEKVSCKYAGIGCKNEPLRKNLEQHEDNDEFHLHLAIEAVNALQKKMNTQWMEIARQQGEFTQLQGKITEQRGEFTIQKRKIDQQWEETIKQREEITKQRREITKQQEEVTKQRREITKQQEEITTQQREITKQQREIDKQQREIDKQQREIYKQRSEIDKQQQEVKVMSENLIAGQAGSCAFKFPKFNQHKSLRREWYSPPFYTHPGGYKMCIRVCANGCDEGAGTHVSVYARMMRGKNDDTLIWPFVGKVTITLLNQLADRHHYTRTTPFPQTNSICGRVRNRERAPIGYGQPNFISHKQLDATWNSQYLKDDCLYFRIQVHATKPVKPWLACTV